MSWVHVVCVSIEISKLSRKIRSVIILEAHSFVVFVNVNDCQLTFAVKKGGVEQDSLPTPIVISAEH